MTIPKNLATGVLAVWVILSGALPLLHISLPYEGTLLDLIAIAAGAPLLVGR